MPIESNEIKINAKTTFNVLGDNKKHLYSGMNVKYTKCTQQSRNVYQKNIENFFLTVKIYIINKYDYMINKTRFFTVFTKCGKIYSI